MRNTSLMQNLIKKKISWIIVILLICNKIEGQPLYQITKNYFRTDPFTNSFSQFLNQLINDPAIIEKKITRRSDSALFYFEGYYKSFSPFFIPVSQCRIILSEKEERTMDSTQTPFYYYEYQLIGYAADAKNGKKDVTEEFEKLNKRFRKNLTETDSRELMTNSKLAGVIKNYTYKSMQFIPLTLAWATAKNQSENIIAVTIRFLNINNTAYLPIPANGP